MYLLGSGGPLDDREPPGQAAPQLLQKNNLAVHTFFYMTLLADIKAERFIHKELLKRALEVVEKVKSNWNKGEKVVALIIAWPAEHINTDAGTSIDGPCIGVLAPVPEAKRRAAIAMFTERTKAYALLLIEPREKEVRMFFESPQGAQEWSLPLERHGDVWVATRPVDKGEGRTKDLFQTKRL